MSKTYTPAQWRALCMGFVLMLLSGLVNGWSIFVEPIEQDLHLLRQDTSLVFTISLSVSIGGQMLAGWLNRRVSSRVIYWIIAALSLIGFTGTSFANGIGAIYLFYGVFSGLAIGMIYNLVLTGVVSLFPSGTSFVSGVLLMGFGVGPLVLGVVAAGFISLAGWRSTFLVLGIVYALLLVLASWMARPFTSRVASAALTGGSTTGQMLKSRPYQYFFLWCVALGTACLVVIGHSSLICRDIGAGVALASLMTGVISVASGVTRPLFGRIADKRGADALKPLLTLCCFGGSVAVLAGYLLGGIWLLALGYLLLGAANGGNAVYICAFVQQRYGSAHYGMNMAVTNIYMIAGSLLGTAVAGGIKTQTGSYGAAFWVMLGWAVVGIVFSRLLSRQDRLEHTGTERNEAWNAGA